MLEISKGNQAASRITNGYKYSCVFCSAFLYIKNFLAVVLTLLLYATVPRPTYAFMIIWYSKISVT